MRDWGGGGGITWASVAKAKTQADDRMREGKRVSQEEAQEKLGNDVDSDNIVSMKAGACLIRAKGAHGRP
jgi:hypothetical protein